MNEYEILLDESYSNGIDVYEIPLESDSRGLCDDKTVALNTNLLDTTAEKRCTLSEEIWHADVTVGNITDTKNINNLKQERFARKCSFKDLVPLDKIVQALINSCLDLKDICEYLHITEEYFCEAITYYKQTYGIYYKCKDYTLFFEPLSVVGSCANENHNYHK